MATLDEIIAKQLAEATALEEAKKIALAKGDVDPETVGKADEVDTKPTIKKELTKESIEEMTDDEISSISMDQLDEISDEVVLRTLQARAKKAKAAKGSSTEKKTSDKLDKTVNNVANRIDRLKKNESTVSTQVAALLEAEGLSEEFKEQAVTIFEAAVTDRVLQIEEGLQTKFETQLAEAKADLDNDIDGFLNEAIQQWMEVNKVAIESNFKSQLAESFMDDMQALMGKHNIELPEGKENALEVALGEVDSLTESVATKETEKLVLVEQINVMKAEKILESFREKMAQTEFDRFVQLTESVKFVDETQYEKQLTIVLENFGKTKVETKVEAEEITEAVIVQKPVTSNVNRYAEFIGKKS